MRCVLFNDEEEYIKLFISLPKKLYDKNDNMEDAATIRSLLEDRHPLSKYFKLYKFLILDKEEVVGRFIITTYPDDDICYLGFFECINDSSVSKKIFDEAKSFAKKNKYKKIIGPVDASFWNKYRLKINMFDKRPYTGEPYNKDYYFKMFKDNGFKVIEHYVSSKYEKPIDYENERFIEKYEKFIKNGYLIKSPSIKEYKKVIDELYYLISDLYSDFPIYKEVSKEDFFSVFASYKYILNMNMVKMAYKDNKAVGFFVSVPNYNNRVYQLNSLKNIWEILRIKKQPKEYVLLYMGVDQNHKGLGSALVESIIKELQVENLSSIGALARDGKVTQDYASDIIEDRYEYVLLGCDSFD